MRKWIIANSLGEGAAMAVAAVLGALFSLIPPDGTSAMVLLPFLMVLTGFMEGLIVGAAQARVLKVPRVRWTLATGGAFGLAWMGGALSSFVESEATPSKATVFVFAGLAGALLGALIGYLQSRVTTAPGLVARSAAAWACGLVVLTITADLVPYGAFGFAALAINTLGGLIAGAVVGVVSWGGVNSLVR